MKEIIRTITYFVILVLFVIDYFITKNKMETCIFWIVIIGFNIWYEIQILNKYK